MHVARHRTTLAILALALAAAPACGDDDGDGATDAPTDDGDDAPADAGDADASPDPDGGAVADCEPRKGTNLSLEPVAHLDEGGKPTAPFDQPVFVTSPPDDRRLFVVSKHGAISIIEDGQILPEPFLDIDDRVASAPADNEQGLLGLAFHPEFARNGRFFVFYTREAGGNPPDRLSEFRVDPRTPDVADPESEREILEVPDEEPNHNGGMIAFGPDGYLYIGMGDGGSGFDPDGNGQNKATLFGDMLRIDVNSTKTPYEVPRDNPYVSDPEGEDTLEEIWISGLRNPWRWSFDRETGDLYIGDVGQGQWEEIDVLPAGKQAGLNLGWAIMEGRECTPPAKNCDQEGLTLPVEVYENPGAAAVVGGYVYRGTCFPDLVGTYFYGDYLAESVHTFRFADGKATKSADVTKDIDPDSVLDGLSSFGQDAFGELYVVSLGDGRIYRIVAGPR
jgi:glucose/arabinose dehydrogenase